MTTPEQYAEALYELVEEHPEKSGEYLSNLRRALEAKGHEKLLPRVYAAYQKLALRKERFKRYAQVTPEQERNRILLELYQRLITS